MSYLLNTSLTAGILSTSWIAEARPVSFVDGWSIMNENRANQSELMTAYTFDRNFALGLHISTFQRDDTRDTFYSPVVSYLALRLNEDRRQTNIYFTAGAGRLCPLGDPDESIGANLFAFDLDSETRTMYGAIRHEITKAKGGPIFMYSRARLGFSPYTANVGGLHTWVLIQVDYDKWKGQTEMTPMLRFFFQNMLWEMGSSMKGHFQFNWATEV
jgi:hypothetical protein